MSEANQAPAVAQLPAGRKLSTNQGHISGRIQSRRAINTATGKLHLTVLKLAAADPYSHPATVELRSSSSLGVPGDDWNGVITLGGMPNNYEVKDKETGEMTRVSSARNEYIVVE